MAAPGDATPIGSAASTEQLTEDVRARIPAPVLELMATLWRADRAAYVVGGCLRDALIGREPADWDLTTDAAPEAIAGLFPRALYENRFGTVVVRHAGSQYEITTFRRDATYSDFRHPDTVEFGSSIEEDLERRDFTVNAMAWGSSPGSEPSFVDPSGGRSDLGSGVLRAVRDPDLRFREDALRMIRAVRLAATLGFGVESETLASISRNAGLAAHLSGERIAAELEKLLAAPRPSIGLRLMAETGLLAVVLPELERQRGLGQNKIEGEDLWDHILRTVDAAPERPIVRLAALLHDVGKPDTLADGHFLGHDKAGAEMAVEMLSRLHSPRLLQERVAHLVANHMFSYQANWSDTAVRRFIRKIGPAAVEDLLDLRSADNVGSGLPADSGGLVELRARIRTQTAGRLVLRREELAVDGRDLMVELGLPPGRRLGRILDELTERVIAEPAINDRTILLDLARDLMTHDGMVDNPQS